jgi:hypothetical protein
MSGRLLRRLTIDPAAAITAGLGVSMLVGEVEGASDGTGDRATQDGEIVPPEKAARAVLTAAWQGRAAGWVTFGDAPLAVMRERLRPISAPSTTASPRR